MKQQVENKKPEANASETPSPSSLLIARSGIRTGKDFACLMSALMTDLIEGRITPGVGNAACNAGGKLLKVVEMQARYGQTNGAREKTLYLTGVPEGGDEAAADN